MGLINPAYPIKPIKPINPINPITPINPINIHENLPNNYSPFFTCLLCQC